MKSGIYLITVQRRGRPNKFYVGQSQHVSRRQREHFGLLRAGKHPNRQLQRAWLVYGEGSFSFAVLHSCPFSELDSQEQKHLDEMRRSVGDRRIFNVLKDCVTSRLGVRDSPETCKKRSAVSKANWQNPTFRETTMNARKIAMSCPEYRDGQSRRSKEIGAKPEYRALQASIQVVVQNRPDVKARKSFGIRAALANPESIERRRITNLLPEVRARRSAAALAVQARRRAEIEAQI